MSQRILVSGGGGYIGTVLTRKLLEKDYHVVALDRYFFGMEPIREFMKRPEYEWIKADIRNVDEAVFKDVNAVVDLAALSNDPSGDLDPDLTRKINCEGRYRIAQLAKKCGVKRYVLASSCSVYGHGGDNQCDEDSEPNPITVYAKANYEAEQRILPLANDDFTVTALRQATVYGLSPRMRFDLVINLMTLSAVQKGRIYVMGGGKQWRPVVHVEDTSEAFIRVLESPQELVQAQVFNVGSTEQNYQIISLAYQVREALPFHVEVEIAPDDADRRNYHVNFDRIKNVLDFTPRKLPSDGVKEIYDALKMGHLEQTPQSVTVKWYRYLLEADQILREVKLDGTLF